VVKIENDIKILPSSAAMKIEATVVGMKLPEIKYDK